MIRLDLGGTWFRSGVVDHTGELRDVRPHTRAGALYRSERQRRYLQPANLMQYVLDEVATRRAEYDPTAHVRVGISLGAAVRQERPAWCLRALRFGVLTRRQISPASCEAQPDVSSTIVNDVSAAAMAFAALPWGSGAKKLAAVTLSTGIALRTIEYQLVGSPTDRRHGIQGETDT